MSVVSSSQGSVRQTAVAAAEAISRRKKEKAYTRVYIYSELYTVISHCASSHSAVTLDSRAIYRKEYLESQDGFGHQRSEQLH